MRRRTIWLFAVALPALVFAASDAKPPSKEAPVQMRPYKVTEQPFEGFTVSYGMRYLLWGPIADASFEDIDSGSLPAKRGIKSGDALLSINGTPVKGMTRKDFEQRFFRTSAVLVVEVQTPGSKEVRKVELRFDPADWEKK